MGKIIGMACAAAAVALAACGGGGGGKGAGKAAKAPQLLGYAIGAPVWLLAEPVAPDAPVLAGGKPLGFVVDPPLPAGLVLDAATGVVSGVPLEPWAETEHVVTAWNAKGSASAVLRITVPEPSLALVPDRPLVHVEVAASNANAADHAGGFGTILVGPSPEWTPSPLVGLAASSADAASALEDALALASSGGAPRVDATESFTANVAVEHEHLSAAIAWDATLLAPFDALAATTTSFAITSDDLAGAPAGSDVVLSLDDGAGGADAIASTPLATARFVLTEHATDLGVDDDGAWVVSRDRFVFAREDAGGERALYAFDPATGDARRVLDMLPGADDGTRVLGTYRGRALFASDNNPLDQAQKLYTYDAAADELLSLCEIWPHTDEDTGRVVEADGELFFAASMFTATRKLFRYAEPDGAQRNVRLAANLSGDTGTTDAPEAVLALDGDVYFVAAPLFGGRKLYRLRTALDVVEQVTDLRGPGADDGIEHVTAAGGRVHFVARTWEGGRKLFQFDPATDTVRQVSDLAGSPASDDGIRELAAAAEVLYAVAEVAPGREKVLRLDVASGALAVLGHTAGVDADDAPEGLLVHGERLWFSARTPAGGRKLFLHDGDALVQVSDVRGDAAADDDPARLLPFGERLAVSLAVAPGVHKLFVADPSAGWLVQVADVAGALADDAPRPRLVVDGALWFTAASGAGTALFRLAEPPTAP